jgi:putative ATP-dependent endonuclease of OLD family
MVDGDLKPSDADPDIQGEDSLPAPPNMKSLENSHVRVFANRTTFERALVFEGTLEMFARTADEIGAPTVAKNLRAGFRALQKNGLSENQKREILDPLRASVLNTAKRFGKARFAQIAARNVEQADTIPKYLADAAEWLTDL